MSLCPLCNGIHTKNIVCSNCKTKMEDGGMLENYYGPYSPYLPKEVLNQVNEVASNHCIHLFYCPNCGYDQHYITKLWVSPDLS
jgi:hypothetical protein